MNPACFPAGYGLVAVPAIDIDPVTAVAFLLLTVAVAGSFLPGVPAGLLSLAGVGLYWWGTGYAEPGPVVLGVIVLTGLLAVLADWFGGVVAARVGGASTSTTVLAGAVGVALLFVAGPIGVLVGSAATVFVVEFLRRRDARAGATAAGAFVLGFFASAFVQALLALSILLAMVGVAFL